jgi:lipid-binding SYLF domain-containing protein
VNTKVRFVFTIVFCIFVTTTVRMALANPPQDTGNGNGGSPTINKATEVFTEIMKTPDKSIPDEVLRRARCIVIVPSAEKKAFALGGTHGKGVATCRTTTGWSAPAPITITGGSWGLQIGGQAVDLVMVVTNDQGMQHLLSSDFKLGGDASVAAGPVGRNAAAGTDWKMNAEVLTYERARDTFSGVTLEGSAITQDKDETRAVYGSFVPFSTILDGRTHALSGSDSFLAAVKKYASVER